jgi:hypothetical protein
LEILNGHVGEATGLVQPHLRMIQAPIRGPIGGKSGWFAVTVQVPVRVSAR